MGKVIIKTLYAIAVVFLFASFFLPTKVIKIIGFSALALASVLTLISGQYQE